MCTPVRFVIIQLLVPKNWTKAILFNHLHVWLPTELDSTQSCCHYLLQISFIICCVLFFHILLFLLMHSLNVAYFLYASSDCTMKPVHQNYSHISSLYLLYTFCMLLLVVVRKMYINIDHIFPVCICCILFVHILLLVYTKRIHQNKSHFLCAFSMYASSIH